MDVLYLIAQDGTGREGQSHLPLSKYLLEADCVCWYSQQDFRDDGVDIEHGVQVETQELFPAPDNRAKTEAKKSWREIQ